VIASGQRFAPLALFEASGGDIFETKKDGAVFTPTVLRAAGASPFTVIGVPACTAIAALLILIKKR
jgi:hypothetical protein